MKLWKILFLILLSVSLVNCAKEVKKKSKSPGTEGVDGGNNPTEEETPPVDEQPPTPEEWPEDLFSNGATVTLTPTNHRVFSDYVGRPINDPQNVIVNVDMIRHDETNKYEGIITIAYINNGEKSPLSEFNTGGSEKAIKYNKWLDNDNNEGTQFHAIFEDGKVNGGAIVLVIDEVVDLGDGGGAEDIVGGSVWFKNFGQGVVPLGLRNYCWFISLGPYDCRPWPSGDGMSGNVSANPASGSGYTHLGTFTGLSLEEAFNDSL